jgi:hypothetical protein
MLADCLKSIGDDTNITEQKVQRLLSNDRKYALVQLRQHTLKFQESFDFKYDWPLSSGAKEKESFEYSVKFTEEYFPSIPYKWVREKIKEMTEQEDQPVKGEIDGVEVEFAPVKLGEGHFPVMFKNYEEVLQHAERELYLPESGERLTYNLLTVDAEKKWSGVDRETMSANTAILMRSPKLSYSNDKGNEVKTIWDIRRADALDIEFVRRDIRDMEGMVDTYLTIEHQKDKSRSTRVDLITVADFFFPSQAT